ncbi:hypothetical protein BV25DRAFT_1783583, partial [Artomyces pyxidatus]
NIWAPFSCKLEWDIVRWAKMRGPTSTAFTELLQIDGVLDRLELSFKTAAEMNALVDGELPERPGFQCEEIEVDGETYEVYFRDVLECVRILYGNPEFAQHMAYAPEQHFADDEMKKRIFSEMHTGDWWWQAQVCLEQDKPGATIVPCLVSTDKTQLTVFRNRSAYPVYLTLGNISKEIRRKPSKQGQILLGYLPTARLEHITNQETRRRALANLFHACMRRIMEPLKKAGELGILMTGGDGNVRRCHPILAAFIGDYPEQALVACVKYGECPKCLVAHDDLGEPELALLRNIIGVMDALRQFDGGTAHYVEVCQAAGIKPVVHPFWEDLPYSNIFSSITPDILHQMYQGMIKHLISWVTDAFGAQEIDARCPSQATAPHAAAPHANALALRSNASNAESRPRVHIARHPIVKSAKFSTLRNHYGAIDFEPALYNLIMQIRNLHITTRQLSRQRIEEKTLPFRSVAVYHNVKFWNRDPQDRENAPDTRDCAHVRPAYEDTRGRAVPGRFDTVLVDMGDDGDSGVEGYRVAQVRVIFSLPIRARQAVFPDDVDAPRHMAYVEWFSPFPDAAEDNHEMYRLTRTLKDGRRVASVIPVANIRRSVHLFPKFGPVAPREWTSSSVLELCDTFYLNCFVDRHTYITI